MKIQNIAKNTSYFTLALILQKVITFAYFAILARNLSPDDLGKYYLALSITSMFIIFIDLGQANVLTREVAKSKEKAKNFLQTIIAIKLPLIVLSVILVIILSFSLGYEELTKRLIYIALICMVLDSLSTTFFAVIRGFHNLKYESVISVIYQVIVLIFGLLSLKIGLGLEYLMLVLALASVLKFIFSGLLIVFKYKLSLFPIFQKTEIKFLFSLSVPFALYGIFQKIYMYLDTILISVLANDYFVGIYQIAFKIVFALQFLPLAFVASLYPAFALYWTDNKRQLDISFERAMQYLTIISLPICVGIIAIADKIVIIFKPEYINAIIPLQIIMISLPFIFLNFPIGSLLNACDKQKINTIIMGIALVVSIIINIILIPKFQAIGASITVLITNALIFILGIYQAKKIVNIRYLKNLIFFGKILFSSVILFLFTLFLKEKLNLFLLIFTNGLIYFIMIILTKAIKQKDIKSIFYSFAKK